ncbi:hypothetical protein [Hymenobacter pini]|uniref:hypothetical protein n=1 Tax=Hymenobacter pini TaxID=2880879 RepID=UPI001CF52221|nr:hypothetical protein [Hymenobacter pini]MCA8830543.1 hypothetical protein [Hymenobacter pini]
MATTTEVMTPAAFLAKWRLRYKDNDDFLIRELDLREQAEDMTKAFVARAQLTVNSIRGNTLLLETLDDLPLVDPNVLAVGQGATVANATDGGSAAAGVEAGPASFRLIKDSTGPLLAYVNSLPATTQRVKASWVRTDGSEQDKVGSYPVFIEEDHFYDPGDVFQFTYPDGSTLLHQVNEPAPRSYQNPLPTGQTDVNYTVFAPLPAPAATGYVAGTALLEVQNSGQFVGATDVRLSAAPIALRIDAAGNLTRYATAQQALDSMQETDACYISGYHAFLRFYRPGTYYCTGAVVEGADLGYYPNGDVQGQKITVYGLSWRKRLCLLVQGAGPSTYRLVNCTGGPNAWVDFFLGFGHRYYSVGDDAWTFEGLRMHYTGAYVPYTQPQPGVGTVTGRGSGLFRYPAGVNPAQVCKLSLLDCALKSDSGPIFSGAAYQADTIRLQGSTTITPGGGKPVAEFTDLQTGADMTAPALAALLLDERPVQSGGTGSGNVDLSNYYTKSESNTRFASYLQIRSTATARVREVPVPTVLQIQSETLDQNAASLSYQLDKNTRVGNRQYGTPDQTLAQVNALLASLSAGELLAGVKLYVKTIPNVAADAATVGLTLL